MGTLPSPDILRKMSSNLVMRLLFVAFGSISLYRDGVRVRRGLDISLTKILPTFFLVLLTDSERIAYDSILPS